MPMALVPTVVALETAKLLLLTYPLFRKQPEHPDFSAQLFVFVSGGKRHKGPLDMTSNLQLWIMKSLCFSIQ